MQENCSFCGLSKKEVKQLIVNDDVAICDICIERCNGIITNITPQETTVEVQRLIDINPQELKAHLDTFVVSQEQAKIVLSVAVSNHYKRINIGGKALDKANVLLLGPSGSGKTLIAKTIADHINVPFAIVDATTLTEAGYVGDDVDSILLKLIKQANGDIGNAETGIIFIDEVDKIAKKNKNSDNGADVSGEGVQQALLKLVEGSVYTIEYEHEQVEFNTSNILFIGSGAFVNLDKITKSKTNIGFGVQLKGNEIHTDTDYDDLIKYGLIPEFVGRFPIIAEVQMLTKEDMLNILHTVDNNLVHQYSTLFKYNDVNITFRKDALRHIVDVALTKKTGARGLRTILEKALLPHMFNVVAYQHNHINKLVISKELVQHPTKIEIKKNTKENKGT